MCASFSLWGKLWSKFGDNGIVTPPHTGSDRPACHQIHRRHHHHHNHYQHHHRCFCNFIIQWKFVFSGICAHVGGIIRFLSMSGVDRLGPDSKDNKVRLIAVHLVLPTDFSLVPVVSNVRPSHDYLILEFWRFSRAPISIRIFPHPAHKRMHHLVKHRVRVSNYFVRTISLCR